MSNATKLIAEQINAQSPRFTCTERYCKHNRMRPLYTDGVKGRVDSAGADWLLDFVASYQDEPEVRALDGFQTIGQTSVLSRSPPLATRTHNEFSKQPRAGLH
jgi:hypothetical protein